MVGGGSFCAELDFHYLENNYLDFETILKLPLDLRSVYHIGQSHLCSDSPSILGEIDFFGHRESATVGSEDEFLDSFIELNCN